MGETSFTVVAEVELEDPSPFEEGVDRLHSELKPALQAVKDEQSFAAEVLRVDAFLRSPHGASPVRFTVELMIRGTSWKTIRETAHSVIEQAAERCGFQVVEAYDQLGSDRSYEQQGTQLVPA